MRVVAEAIALTLGEGIPVELYSLTWAISGRDGAAYRQAFEALYHLEIGTIVDGGVPVDAMIPVGGYTSWWLDIALFLLTPGAACLDGCTQSQRPT